MSRSASQQPQVLRVRDGRCMVPMQAKAEKALPMLGGANLTQGFIWGSPRTVRRHSGFCPP